jgi:hypothetical protein
VQARRRIVHKLQFAPELQRPGGRLAHLHRARPGRRVGGVGRRRLHLDDQHDCTISTKPAATSATAAPSFSFTSTAYTSFACKLDAGTFGACTSPQAYTGLADGSHTFTIHAIDANGVATADAVYTWTINTVAPTLNPLTLKVTGGNTTATATFSHTIYTSFQCALDAGAFAACTSGAQFTVATGSGSHTVKVRAVDSAGATTLVASRTFTA